MELITFLLNRFARQSKKDCLFLFSVYESGLHICEILLILRAKNCLKKIKKYLKKVLIFIYTSCIIRDVDCEDVRGCWNTESRCHDGVPGNSH